MINEGVRRAYTHPDNTLRASILEDPAGRRQNTKDNTPAVIHTRLVPGNTVSVHVAAKGGGSENKSKLVMLNPSDSIVDWVAKTLPTMGAGWCPPAFWHWHWRHRRKGDGAGKESLMAPVDIHELRARGRKPDRRTAPRDYGRR